MSKKIRIGSDVTEQVAAFYNDHFSSRHSGALYALNLFPMLYKNAVKSLRGTFDRTDLELIIKSFAGYQLEQDMAGQQLYSRLEKILTGRKTQGVDGDALMKKVLALPFHHRVFLEVWAAAYWFHGDIDTQVWIKDLLPLRRAK
jgi:hypothetical protein